VSEPLSVIANHLLNALEGVRRAAEEGRIVLKDRDLACLANGSHRLLTELRGSCNEQILGELASAFALKILRLETEPCKRT